MANENNQLFRGLGAGALEVPSDLVLTAQDQLTPLFTITRATGNITAPVAGVTFSGTPSAGQVLTATSSSAAHWQSAGSTSPAGSNTQIQFNNSGSFGASSNMLFDGIGIVANKLTAGNWTTAQSNNQESLVVGPSSVGLNRTIFAMYQPSSNGLLQIECSNGGGHSIGVGDVHNDLHIAANGSNGILLKNGTGLVIIEGRIQLNDNTTGSGTASLSTNCPAVTPTAPYTWAKIQTSDGSVGYVPVWK